MPTYNFERETRTPHSEAFVIEAGRDAVGRGAPAYGTRGGPAEFDDAAIEELIGEIDERLVMSWEPLRDDFIVTVWAGREGGVFSETGGGDEEGEGDNEGGNGTQK